MQTPPIRAKQTVTTSQSGASSAVISALPISVQGMQDSPELANMSIGQLLGHGQRRVSVAQVAAVAPVSGGIQMIRPLQGGGITMSQAQQQTVNSPALDASSVSSRPVVQLRVEGNRIVSGSELRQQPDTKVAFITSNGIPLSRASVTPVQQVRRVPSECVRVSPVLKPSTILQESSDGNVTNTGTLLEKARLDDLMKQIDPSAIIEDPAKDALLEFMDDFVEEVIERTCQVSHHRGAEMIETKDVEYVLEKYFKIPRFPKGNGIADLLKSESDIGFAEKRSRRADFTAHNQRLSVINKTIKKT